MHNIVQQEIDDNPADGYKPHVFKYKCRDREWYMEIPAYNREDAEHRLTHLAKAEWMGAKIDEYPILSPRGIFFGLKDWFSHWRIF